jgi:protein-arginine kinase activator protein McsA
MTEAKDAKARKEAQRQRDKVLGIKRVEVRLSIREREQLDILRAARAGADEPYSADEYLSTMIRRDWEKWQAQEAELKKQTCPNCDCALPTGCGGAFKGQSECWHTQGDKTLAL